MQKNLIVISITFTKAFDIIKRDKMMEVLKNYQGNPKIIEFITKLYKGDTTTIRMEEDINIAVGSGNRQGCNGSTMLFKLMPQEIMQALEELNMGYRDESFNITSLFFVNDGLLLVHRVEDPEKVIDVTINVGKICGLEIKKQKSNNHI